MDSSDIVFLVGLFLAAGLALAANVLGYLFRCHIIRQVQELDGRVTTLEGEGEK